MAEGEIVPAGEPNSGRPLSYTQEIADIICDRLSLGESLRSICDDDAMPSRMTVFRWLRRDDEIGTAFRDQYAHAREAQADSLFDEMNEIADDGTNDWMEKRDKDGALIGWQLNGEHVQRSKLRIETRKWQAAKLKPKKYGEKIDITSGDEPIQTDINDVAARAAALLAAARARKDAAKG